MKDEGNDAVPVGGTSRSSEHDESKSDGGTSDNEPQQTTNSASLSGVEHVPWPCDGTAPIPMEYTSAACDAADDAAKGIESLEGDEPPLPPAQVAAFFGGHGEKRTKKKPDQEGKDTIGGGEGGDGIADHPSALSSNEGGPQSEAEARQQQPSAAASDPRASRPPSRIIQHGQSSSRTPEMVTRPPPRSMLPPLPNDQSNLPIPTHDFHEVQATLVEPEPETPLYEATLLRNSVASQNNDDTPQPWYRRQRSYLIFSLMLLIIGVLAGVIGTLLASRNNETGSADPESTRTIGPEENPDEKQTASGAPPTPAPMFIRASSNSPTATTLNPTADPSGGPSLVPSEMPTDIPLCLKVTTGSLEYHDGPVNIFVDSGSGYDLVSTRGKVYGLGDIVVDRCFNHIVGIQVSNTDDDEWMGFVEVSADGKATYYPLICSDCSGTTDIMPIAVDGDNVLPVSPTGFDQLTTWCLNGASCTLKPSSFLWKQLGQTLTGDYVEDRFGTSTSVSADGEFVALGIVNDDPAGPNSGAVKVYKWNEMLENYAQIGDTITGKAKRGYFGSPVILSQDGKTLAVGSSMCGDRNSNCERWAWEGECESNPKYMHLSCKRSCRACGRGSGLMWGTDQDETGWKWAGYVEVYKLENDSSWKQVRQFVGEEADLMGFSISLSVDGKVIAMSAPGRDSRSGFVKIYKQDDVSALYMPWGDAIIGSADEYLGHSLALSGDSGTTLVIGHPYDATPYATNEEQFGWVKTYRIDEEQLKWNLISQLNGTNANDYFGWAVSISQDGNTLVCSAPRSGDNNAKFGTVSVYGLDNESNNWEQRGSDMIGLHKDQLGESVSLSHDGKSVALGAKLNGSKGKRSGQAMVYKWDDVTLNYVQVGSYLTGDHIEDEFGSSVALSSSGTHLVVGAHFAEEEFGHVKVFQFDNSTIIFGQ